MDERGVTIIVIGGGGHAKVLLDALLLRKREILGFTDPDPSATSLGIACLGNDASVFSYSTKDVELVNGIGSIGSPAKRKEIYERFCSAGFVFASVIHPGAAVSAAAKIDRAVQIMAGAIVQPGCRIASNAIINTGAIIDHDCIVGMHAHVAPGAVLSGNVCVGAEAHIGTGACIIQGISIGTGSVVGAGAVVVKDVPPGLTVVGVPAKALGRADAGMP